MLRATRYRSAASAFSLCKKGLWSGFARVFCDVHCVRDAVIRGDRSIIRNLELATTLGFLLGSFRNSLQEEDQQQSAEDGEVVMMTQP